MAYANGPASSGPGGSWTTDASGVVVFHGDYRQELHLEDPETPLYKQQQSMPSLPLCSLEKSCEIYLQSLLPLATEQEYADAERAVAQFLASPQSRELQQRLVARVEKYHNSSWLQHWWNTLSYLQFRESTVINVSYFFQFKSIAGVKDQVQRAAGLVRGALLFRQRLLLGEDVNASARGTRCAVPYKYMFNSCRIPISGSDKSLLYPPTAEHNTLLVICNRQFFTFPVTGDAGASWAPLSEHDIMTQLRRVVAMSAGSSPSADTCVGALTATHRDTWATNRDRLVSEGNTKFLDAVQAATMCLVLDQSAPATRDDTAQQLWHGDACNRWFDKIIQVIVFANGNAGLVGEHSNFDGQAMVEVADFCLKYERQSHRPLQDGWSISSALPAPAALSDLLHLSLTSRWGVQNALAEYGQLVAQHDMATLAFHGSGKARIKSLKMSPDAFVQMCIQLAYYRMFGESRATYEPVSMRNYRHGRTETVRSVSAESLRFVRSMSDPSKSSSEQLVALRAAANAHVRYIKRAVKGEACDRHMLGLRRVISEGEETPEIFKQPIFWRSCYWHISTSNLSHELFESWGWGEVVPDGLGVAYSIVSDRITFNVSSRRSFAAAFCQHLEDALVDMFALGSAEVPTRAKL